MTELRAIHLALLDKQRPVLVLTRHWAVAELDAVVVAPIGTRVRGLPTEIHVGPANGLDHNSVVNVDSTSRILRENFGPPIGFLLAHQEQQLIAALSAAFDLQI